MDAQQFDNFARLLGRTSARRPLLGGLVLSPLAGLVARAADDAEAKKKRKKKGRKDKKTKPNAFGCLNMGKACKNESQCCSGICEGKKGKRTCRAHDTSICKVDADICAAGQGGRCGIYNANCLCVKTTGDAPFCGDFTTPSILCRNCSHDTDCEEEFGPGAACVVYGGICNSYCPHTGGTSCLPACNDSAE
jgi:hypothetical protein